MTYMDLKKLYFINQEESEKVYQQRYSAENTVHLDFEIAGYQSFFVQCDDVIRRSHKILTLDKEIFALQQKLPKTALEQYTRRCLIDEIVITNNIEGVYSSRKEIGEALKILEEQSARKQKKYKFLGLVNKYLKLLSHETVPLKNCRDIRRIYDEIVLEEVVYENKDNAPDGEIFRKGMTEVYSATGKSIHKGVYPESNIISYMEKALHFLNDENVLLLYRLSLFHFMLGYIHPFYDGNGRLGRFILSYDISWHFERVLAYRISQTIKENIKAYYHAFSVCNDMRNRGDLTPFLIMMLEMIEQAMEDLRDALNEKYKLWKHYQKMISMLDEHNNKMMHSLYDVLIQAALFSEQGISTEELLSLFMTNYATLGKRLAIVKDQGLLAMQKHGHRKYYSIDQNKLDELIV